MLMIFFRLFLLFLMPLCASAKSKSDSKSELRHSSPPVVIGRLQCQLGNNLFQVAATCAHAWDNGAEPIFPDLLTPEMQLNYQHVLFRCKIGPRVFPSMTWTHPNPYNHMYSPIPYKPNMLLAGNFQTQKYFAHHREALVELFAPHPSDWAYIEKKYHFILNHPCTVGIQIRWFAEPKDAPWQSGLAQYGYDYFQKAIAQFPENALFVISSNNMAFAKANLPKGIKNILFLESEPYYIDFFLLSRCQHNIISNSSFGWWAAWLNPNPRKIVVHPEYWINPALHVYHPTEDVYPPEWIKVTAEWVSPPDYKKLARKD